jgi:hypothetical protein
MRDQVTQDEITFDQTGSIYPQPSIFDYFDDVEPLGEENRKRKDGTFTCNPSLEGYQNGEKFKLENK